MHIETHRDLSHSHIDRSSILVYINLKFIAKGSHASLSSRSKAKVSHHSRTRSIGRLWSTSDWLGEDSRYSGCREDKRIRREPIVSRSLVILWPREGSFFMSWNNNNKVDTHVLYDYNGFVRFDKDFMNSKQFYKLWEKFSWSNILNDLPEDLEKYCEEQEITIDYFIEEFMWWVIKNTKNSCATATSGLRSTTISFRWVRWRSSTHSSRMNSGQSKYLIFDLTNLYRSPIFVKYSSECGGIGRRTRLKICWE